MKIKLLSKYYDEVLTFTYKYVILKDYTIIPINDVMDRFHDYQYSEYIGGPNNESEIPKVFKERSTRGLRSPSVIFIMLNF